MAFKKQLLSGFIALCPLLGLPEPTFAVIRRTQVASGAVMGVPLALPPVGSLDVSRPINPSPVQAALGTSVAAPLEKSLERQERRAPLGNQAVDVAAEVGEVTAGQRSEVSVHDGNKPTVNQLMDTIRPWAQSAEQIKQAQQAGDRLVTAMHGERSIKGAVKTPTSRQTYQLPSGAKLRTRLKDADFRRLAGMAHLRDETPFQVKNQGSVLTLANLYKGWGITDSELRYIEHVLHVSLVARVRQLLQKSTGRVTVVDWGCGDGRAVRALAQELQGLPVDLIGFGDTPFPAWWKASAEVMYILDRAENLPRYFKANEISLVYSHLGLEHLGRDGLKNQLRRLRPVLRQDGEIWTTGWYGGHPDGFCAQAFGPRGCLLTPMPRSLSE